MRDTAPATITDAERTCSVPDCDRAYYAKGWCNMHYARVRKHGHPEGGYWWLARRQRRASIINEMREAYAAAKEAMGR